MIFLSNGQNLVADSAITVTGGNVNFPAENLHNDTMQNGTVFTDEIQFDLGSALDVDTIAIANPTATITVEGGSDPTWVAPAGVTKVMSTITGDYDNPLIAIEFNTTGKWTYRYWRITATGGAYLTHFWLGEKINLNYASFGTINTIMSNDTKTKTQNGRFLGTNGSLTREPTFSFEGQPKAEFDKQKALWLSYRLRPGVFMQWENNPDYEQPFFAIIDTFETDQIIEDLSYSWSINILEVK